MNKEQRDLLSEARRLRMVDEQELRESYFDSHPSRCLCVQCDPGAGEVNA